MRQTELLLSEMKVEMHRVVIHRNQLFKEVFVMGPLVLWIRITRVALEQVYNRRIFDHYMKDIVT